MKTLLNNELFVSDEDAEQKSSEADVIKQKAIVRITEW